MSREKEIFDKFAMEVASEILAKERDPFYELVLDKVSIIKKLSSITGKEYTETSEIFEKKVTSYVNSLRLR